MRRDKAPVVQFLRGLSTKPLIVLVLQIKLRSIHYVNATDSSRGVGISHLVQCNMQERNSMDECSCVNLATHEESRSLEN